MRTLRRVTCVVVLVSFALLPVAGGAAVSRKTLDPLLHWIPLVEDPATADSAFTAIGDTLPALADSSMRAFAHYMRFTAAMTLDRLDTMRLEAESTMALGPADATPFTELMQYLQRRHELALAETYGQRAVDVYESTRDTVQLPTALRWLAYLQGLRGEHHRVVASLERSMAVSSEESQWGLASLGEAYWRTGNAERAAEMLTRSLSVFPGDTVMARGTRAMLDSVLAAQHRPAGDADARIARVRAAARRRYYFDSRRDGGRAPALRLHEIQRDRPTALAWDRGLTVAYCWGTWCGPCRHAIRDVQTEFRRPRQRPVRFITINWEYDSPRVARERVTTFARDSALTFPIFLADSAAATRLGLHGLPTVLVIRDGRVLYRNVGFDAEEVLQAQLADLGAAPAATSARSGPEVGAR